MFKKLLDNLTAIVLLVLKFGGKVISIGAKLLKSATVVKGGLAVASFASYSVMFTWEFALFLMLMLFIHESGHVWAMRKCGIPTKGFYFLPFVGGAAVADRAFKSRWEEFFVGIMGPIWGFAISLVMAGAYSVTTNPLFAAASSMMALINLINLLPINPLDGGRIAKSIAFSIHSWLGYFFLVLGIVACGVFAVWAGAWILILFLVAGVVELFEVYKRRIQIPTMNIPTTLLASASYIFIVAIFVVLIISMAHVPGADIALEVLKD